ncbi:DUF3806 domain-containing protein [Massilia sp. W12]|uniref:DUF3806 domain-containing protein n=1 Tax=Massilia sp. W12 TaxID=3126507 RepID=UPI0030D3CCF1
MKHLIVALLSSLIFIAANAADDGKQTFETPDGPVTATKKTAPPVPQKISAVGSKELAAFEQASARALRFVTDYVPRASNPKLTDFDKAFYLWQKEKSRRYSEQQVIEMIGAYLGNQLVKDFQMEWVVVSDQYGTDYAVRGKQKEVMSFPFASVEKRIQRKEHEFVVGVYQTVKHTLADADIKAR